MSAKIEWYDRFVEYVKNNNSGLYKNAVTWADDVVYYARKCSITGEGMDAGFVVEGSLDIMYFKYQKDLIKYLRDQGDEVYNKASDDFILEESHNNGWHYWTDWIDDEPEYCYNPETGEVEELLT